MKALKILRVRIEMEDRTEFHNDLVDLMKEVTVSMYSVKIVMKQLLEDSPDETRHVKGMVESYIGMLEINASKLHDIHTELYDFDDFDDVNERCDIMRVALQKGRDG